MNSTMNHTDRKKLQKNYVKLVNDVKYYQVSAYLISKFVLDLRMDAEIKSAKTEQEQMGKLLGILQTRGEHSFKHFVAALKTSSPWLADELDVDVEVKSEKPYEILEKIQICDVSIADFIPEVRRTLEKSPTVCRNWRTVANSMRLHHTTIQDIEENNRFRTSNAIYDVLQHWVDECGNQKATFGSLIDILQTERMAFAADEVEKLWIKLSSTNAPSCQLS
ncbi:uncharacterized protein LOC110846536 [Folsomia candida]|uniref:Death domain-containing protein CRADD n=1 Tax=Folsomia candida TaxID=158441 RepID=A0A226EHZ5_FOLCA|nr:uncharacterized protein LOC110846536 [Folsomia candida]OXA57285.1 Death domain-containing protein CRADD [Folsomia candida]